MRVLKKYGAPAPFCNIVERLYSDLKVIINLEGESISIPQTSGVRQGDNLSPVLFLFIMSAVTETLDKELERNGIEKPKCRGVNSQEIYQGLLTGQIPKNFKSGREISLLEFLYIDDGAFVFGSRANLIKGLKIIKRVFEDFGLEMHVGTSIEASKTECIFYPTSDWFKKEAPLPTLPSPHTTLICQELPAAPESESIVNTNPEATSSALVPKKIAESDQSRKKRCDLKYDQCEETNRIMLDDEKHVDFTKNFLYLGSSTSYDLRDDDDINRRIATASRSMGMLKNFWDNPYIDMYTKHLFYLAIPVNLLLWGCETWALKKSSLIKLESFHHRSIRRILKINMIQVREEKISNKQVRKMFHNIPEIGNLIAAFQLRFVGKVVRHPHPEHIPKLLLSAWVDNKRPAHGVLETNKKSIVKALKKLYLNTSETDPFEGGFGHMDSKGSFNLWYEDALDESKWNWLIEAQLRRTHLKIARPNTSESRNHNSNQSPPPPNDGRSNPPSPPPNRSQDTPSRLILDALNTLDLPPSTSAEFEKSKVDWPVDL